MKKVGGACEGGGAAVLQGVCEPIRRDNRKRTLDEAARGRGHIALGEEGGRQLGPSAFKRLLLDLIRLLTQCMPGDWGG